MQVIRAVPRGGPLGARPAPVTLVECSDIFPLVNYGAEALVVPAVSGSGRVPGMHAAQRISLITENLILKCGHSEDSQIGKDK